MSVSTREHPGLFVAFEGGEGAGKTTLTAELARRLRADGHEVVTTREPGGTELGIRLREILLNTPGLDARTQLMLFAADRSHHVATVIAPALARGAVVLCDRYLGSTIAYQGVQGTPVEQITQVSDLATDALRPDLTITLDVDAATRRARRGLGSDVFERQDEQFHESVRVSFLIQACADPARNVIISAALPAEQVAELALNAIGSRLGVRAADQAVPA